MKDDDRMIHHIEPSQEHRRSTARTRRHGWKQQAANSGSAQEGRTLSQLTKVHTCENTLDRWSWVEV